MGVERALALLADPIDADADASAGYLDLLGPRADGDLESTGLTQSLMLTRAVRNYLLDIQPGYSRDPVRGVYNHGWIVGDDKAISVPAQSDLDGLLEIKKVSGTTDGKP